MRYVLTKDLRPDMIIGKSITSDCEDILLRAGVKLTLSYIRLLKAREINGLYIEDEYSKSIVIKDVIDPQIREKATKEIKANFERILTNNGKLNEEDETKPVKEIVSKIINSLMNNEEIVVNMVDIRTIGEEIFAHSVNVTVLSLMIGVALKMNTEKLYNLGMASLLHDIPKAKFTSELLNKERYSEFNIIDRLKAKKFINEGFELIEKQKLPMETKLAIKEHCKRMYVDEYPICIKKQPISIYAEIIGLCDVYDNLVSGKSNDNVLPSDALEYIMGYSNVLFDIEIVKVFITKIAIYPIGSIVRLSNGELAIVIQNFNGYTNRPVVRLVNTNEIIKLMDKNNLSTTIISIYNAEEIRKLKHS